MTWRDSSDSGQVSDARPVAVTSPVRGPQPTEALARDPRHPVPRLWRSRSNRVVAGVLGGLAEKFGWEARPVRLLFGLLGALTLPLGGLPVIVPYVIVWGITRAHGPTTPAVPLRRSRDDQVVSGLLAGVAVKLGMRPRLVRLTYAALTMVTMVLPGVVTYLVLWAKTPGAERADDDEALG